MADGSEPTPRSVATVAARAALAGNPSDGHGGAVVAVPLPRLAATTTITPKRSPAARPVLRSARAADDVDAVAGHAPDDDLTQLVEATLRAATRLVAVPDAVVREIEVRVQTTIPRSVGLAGSSAIAIGVLRALGRLHPTAPWAGMLAQPGVLAVVAHQAEVTELGIAAGLQDRLVQAHRTPLLMEFGPSDVVDVLDLACGSVTPIGRPPGRFVLAHRAVAAQPSGAVHGELADRVGTDALMSELARSARSAAMAIRRGSIGDLGAAMDRTFELRTELLELDPRHVEMVEVARDAGGHANYTGSGGAVIAVCRDEAVESRIVEALGRLDGCVVTPDPLSGTGPTDSVTHHSVSHPPA